MESPYETTYRTQGGISIRRTVRTINYQDAVEPVLSRLDTHPGALFASGQEVPGRYSRWDIGFVNPPLAVTARGRSFRLQALNDRGRALLGMLSPALKELPLKEKLIASETEIRGEIVDSGEPATEEERLNRPTIVSLLRALRRFFFADAEPHLGLYGAFGYDLTFQFEPIRFKHERGENTRDLHLYLPDELYIVDHGRRLAEVRSYEFFSTTGTTEGQSRVIEAGPLPVGKPAPMQTDHAPGEYAAKVEQIREGCRVGDFFEVVPSQRFSIGYQGTPRKVFESLRRSNPSPYEFFINLGDQHLVGASPEMYVRVDGKRVETCPISGTIARGRDALEDAEQIRRLLDSKKDEAELTMCTDVDRNDKARVCRPGTVRVVGRRLIETYSRLFHTVDHVEGELAENRDALDAFVAHMWACTLTGAPKPAAMQKIEDLERSPREWYGGAVGMLRFDGTINTGITIRTLQLMDGEARLRVGATVLYDSDPQAEEEETRVKGAAFLDAAAGKLVPRVEESLDITVREPRRVLLVDHRDSFVHTLADYIRQTGAEVTTVRSGFPLSLLDERKPDLVFLSPGPGRPDEFGVPDTVKACVERGLPVFGVCLGLQGMVEAFGGKLGVLPEPWHGKPSQVRNAQRGVFADFPEHFTAGRYHSLYAEKDHLPDCLEVTAESEDGIVMAVAHKELPLAAVQFHPESILTLGERLGHRLIMNVVRAAGQIVGD